MIEFENLWRQRYGSCAPVGYMLRAFAPQRWVRIHTLPGSKRYPDTPDEMEVILGRHNSILQREIGVNEACYLLVAGYEQIDVTALPALEDVAGAEWQTVHFFVDEEADPTDWFFFVTKLHFEVDALNQLLKKVIDASVGNVMVVSFERDFAYHPYDGGADIFVDESQVEPVRQRYKEWKPLWPMPGSRPSTQALSQTFGNPATFQLVLKEVEAAKGAFFGRVKMVVDNYEMGNDLLAPVFPFIQHIEGFLKLQAKWHETMPPWDEDFEPEFFRVMLSYFGTFYDDFFGFRTLPPGQKLPEAMAESCILSPGPGEFFDGWDLVALRGERAVRLIVRKGEELEAFTLPWDELEATLRDCVDWYYALEAF
ncbi:hypothetical protein EON80_14280 [bacterium]|nr:MAG: hypothetical protein EON80_14280 [bacterium]